MASFVEQVMAPARDRTTPFATALGGGGGAGPPDRLRKMAAELLQRRPAHREWVASPGRALASARSLAQQTFSGQGTQGKLKGLKDQLQDLESRLAQALSVQLRKESKHKHATESILNTTAMIEQLNNSVTGLRNEKDKRTAVISEQLKALEPLEAKSNEAATLQETIEEVLFWYDKFLGFKVAVGGEGVKFVFNKIDPQSPEKEYSFCIKFDKDRHILTQCDPCIKGSEELVKDLNLSDDLLRFVRIIREKFQSSAANGILPVSSVVGPEVSAAPLPSPVTTSVNGRSEDVPNQSHSQSKNTKRSLPAKRGATAVSAASPGSLRRSPRFEGTR